MEYSSSKAIISDNSIVREERQAKEWTPAKVIYTGLMAFNLLSFLWLLATGSGIDMPAIIWIARIATAPLAIYLGKLWKDRGFQILSVYTLFFFFRAYISNPESIFTAELSESVLSALWLFAGCYGLGRILSKEMLKRFLFIIAAIWIVGILIYSLIGIYTAWTNSIIPSLGKGTFELSLWRLDLIYPATTSGMILGCTALIAFICSLCVRRRGIKVLFFLCSIPMIITLALTDSRTAIIGFVAGSGIIAYILLNQYFQNNTRFVTKSKWITISISVAIMILLCAIMILAIFQIIPLFNHMKAKGFIASAMAEEPDSSVLIGRGFGENGYFGLLSGRDDLWKRIFEYLLHKPKYLLIGESKVAPLRNIEKELVHCHSVYIQVLLESGIPGLILILSFIIHVLTNCYRAIDNKKSSLWISLLTALVVCLWVADLAECFTWLRSSQCLMATIPFVCAGIINSQQIKSNQAI